MLKQADRFDVDASLRGSDSWPTPVECKPFDEHINISDLNGPQKRLVWNYLIKHQPETAALLSELRADFEILGLIEATDAKIELPISVFDRETRQALNIE